MAERITCCPYCSTSFRVTDAQLQTAKGAVRCGSCLQIFRALDHLIETPPAPSAPAAATTYEDDQPTDAGPADSTIPYRFDPDRWDDAYADSAADDSPDFDDDQLISDDMDGDGSDHLGDLSDSFLEETQRTKGSLFDRPAKLRDARTDDQSDESWALSLLEEMDEDGDADDKREPRLGAPGEAELWQTPEEASQEQDADDFISFSDERDDDERDDLAAEHSTLDFGRAVDEPIDFGDINPSDSFTRREQEPEEHDPSLQDTDELESDDEQLYRLATEFETVPLQPERPSLVDTIAPAPVEMDWHPPASPWPRRLLWGGLSLLALLALAGQYGWYRFDDLSRQQPWRDLYARVCPLLGCQLPSVYAPDKVKAYNLVVRSHPRVQEALVVDSILLNTASVEQPFPDFVLTFSNLQGEQLAARRFQPREYLGGELAGATMMPPGQPVHISLELVDPGPEAVNYTAHIPTDTPERPAGR